MLNSQCTGLSERWMLNAFKGVEVIKGGGTTDTGEKKVKVELLFRGGVGMIHPANGNGTLLPDRPLVCALVPNHPGGKILVEKIMIICQLSISLKPCSECGIMIWVCIHQVLDISIIILFKDNRPVIRKVNLKVNNSRGLLLHGKEI
jgi:hypothetical protein